MDALKRNAIREAVGRIADGAAELLGIVGIERDVYAATGDGAGAAGGLETEFGLGFCEEMVERGVFIDCRRATTYFRRDDEAAEWVRSLPRCCRFTLGGRVFAHAEMRLPGGTKLGRLAHAGGRVDRRGRPPLQCWSHATWSHFFRLVFDDGRTIADARNACASSGASPGRSVLRGSVKAIWDSLRVASPATAGGEQNAEQASE